MLSGKPTHLRSLTLVHLLSALTDTLHTLVDALLIFCELLQTLEWTLSATLTLTWFLSRSTLALTLALHHRVQCLTHL